MNYRFARITSSNVLAEQICRGRGTCFLPCRNGNEQEMPSESLLAKETEQKSLLKSSLALKSGEKKKKRCHSRKQCRLARRYKSSAAVINILVLSMQELKLRELRCVAQGRTGSKETQDSALLKGPFWSIAPRRCYSSPKFHITPGSSA